MNGYNLVILCGLGFFFFLLFNSASTVCSLAVSLLSIFYKLSEMSFLLLLLVCKPLTFHLAPPVVKKLDLFREISQYQ